MNAATILLALCLMLHGTQGMFSSYQFFRTWVMLLLMRYQNSFLQNKTYFIATDVIDSLELKADPQTTTPNNCTCTSTCRCAVDYSDCDPGNPISWWPKLSTSIGEVRDWCFTGRPFTFRKCYRIRICDIKSIEIIETIIF